VWMHVLVPPAIIAFSNHLLVWVGEGKRGGGGPGATGDYSFQQSFYWFGLGRGGKAGGGGGPGAT